MTRTIIILILIFLTTYNVFGQSDSLFKKADHYKNDKFDVAIFPKSYLDLISGQRFTPTRQEVEKAEIALNNNLKLLNKQLVNQSPTRTIHQNLHKYKRQYFGYQDEKGNKILLINCFWSKDKDESDRWLKNRIIVLDGGSNYWNVKFNLDKNELFALDINGNG